MNYLPYLIIYHRLLEQVLYMYVMLFLSSIVLELMNTRASPVKMTDHSFDKYILSLFLGLVYLHCLEELSATCRETTHTLPSINVCNIFIVHSEVRVKESVVDAP